MKRVLLALGVAGLVSAGAQAQVSEIRVGVVAHDVVDHAEDGPQISIETLFNSPDFLGWAGSPRPYLYGSFSTQGYTNLVAAGLDWSGYVAGPVKLNGSFGISYNDGVDDVVDLPPDDPVRIETAATRALLGSEWLFRTSIGMDVDLSENWTAGIYYEHFSHGQILGNGRNQALDEVGVRVGYRFGG